MQDSPCDSDMYCICRKFKISYECRFFFAQISFFSNFGMFFEHFQLQFRDIIFFLKIYKIPKNQKIKFESNYFINATALRAPPAVTRLTVHRRLQVPGRMPFGLICRLRNLLPGDRTEAISRYLFITFVKHEFSSR